MAKASGRDSDPLVSFQFKLEVSGAITGFFTEVGGLGSESEVAEQKLTDSKGNPFVQKVPGRNKWTDVTLKRGITDSMDVWEWRDLVIQGKMKDARKHGSIIMYDRNGTAAAKWDFENAWPSKVTGPSIKSDSNEFGIEEMTLVHEGIKRVKP